MCGDDDDYHDSSCNCDCNCGGCKCCNCCSCCHTSRACDRCCDRCCSFFLCCECFNMEESEEEMQRRERQKIAMRGGVAMNSENTNDQPTGVTMTRTSPFKLDYQYGVNYWSTSVRMEAEEGQEFELRAQDTLGSPRIDWNFNVIPSECESEGMVVITGQEAIINPGGRINAFIEGIADRDSARTIIMELSVGNETLKSNGSISTILCYGSSHWFAVGVENKSGAKLIFGNREYIVDSNIKIPSADYVKVALSYDGKVLRWYSIEDGDVTLTNAVEVIINTITDGSMGLGSFPDKSRFQGKIRRFIMFNQVLDPENDHHKKWFTEK